MNERLLKVAKQAETGLIGADIGTDHAYLPVFLVENKIIPRAYASDLREGPLERAKCHIEEAGLTDRIETILVPGLEGLRPGMAEQCFICGMGGLTMIDILTDSPDTARAMRRLVLQPQNNSEKLRQWLAENRYIIEQENIAREDRRYYEILTVRPLKEDEASMTLSETECFLGKKDCRVCDQDRLDYLNDLRARLMRILEGMNDTSHARSLEKKGLIEEKLRAVEEELDAFPSPIPNAEV